MVAIKGKVLSKEEIQEKASRIRVPFSADQLEDFKDQISGWWSVESMRYDHKQMVAKFQLWAHCSKSEAVEMEFKTRDDSEKIIENILNWKLFDLKIKMQEMPIITFDLSLSKQLGATGTLLFRGEETTFDVDGDIHFVGHIDYKNGSRQDFHQKFVSHPFWQYSHRITENYDGSGSDYWKSRRGEE